MAVKARKSNERAEACPHDELSSRVHEALRYVHRVFGHGAPLIEMVDRIAESANRLKSEGCQHARFVDTIVATRKAERLVALQGQGVVHICRKGERIGRLSGNTSIENVHAALSCIATGIAIGRDDHEKHVIALLSELEVGD